MPRNSTPSFIVELPLIVSQNDERIIADRMEVGRRINNAVTGFGLDNLNKMRSSKAFQDCKAIKDKAKRSKAFKQLRIDFGFTDGALQAYARDCRVRGGFENRISSHHAQTIATKVFKALEQYAMGKRGKPRFKGHQRPLHSLQDKQANTGIIWKNDIKAVKWDGLLMFAKMPNLEKDLWLKEALSCKTKFNRIVWRNIKDRKRYFVQLIQSGLAPQKYQTGLGIIGTDCGVSAFGIASETTLSLEKFAPSVKENSRKKRQIQRAMDRSRRATNPDCFNANGTIKKGTKIKVRSNNYNTLRTKLAEQERILSEARKRDHGNLANRVMALGNVIQTEKVSIKAWQRRYGKAIKSSAPSMFFSLLQRKAERAGGAFIELDTWKLKLSQYDHATDTYTKKKLSTRWHTLGDGSGVVQRDIYSAWLAQQCVNHAVLGTQHQLIERWAGVKTLLAQTPWMRKECANVLSLLATTKQLPKAKLLRQSASFEKLNGSDGYVPICLIASQKAPQSAVRTSAL